MGSLQKQYRACSNLGTTIIRFSPTKMKAQSYSGKSMGRNAP